MCVKKYCYETYEEILREFFSDVFNEDLVKN